MKFRSIQLECLQLLLWPVIRYCMRHSYSYQDFINVAKIIFVRAAEEEIRKSTTKVNVSRISALTGIYRDDVKRIYYEKPEPSAEPLSVLGRIIGQWEQDSRFRNAAGKPRVLSYQGPDSEFHELVSAVSMHLNPGTMVFELQRIGVVEKTVKGLKLVRQLAAPEDDLRRGFEILSNDMETLIQAIEENLYRKSRISNLHIRTEYDNVFTKDLPKIRLWLIKEGKKFHRKARNFLSKFDQDIHPNPKAESGGKVTITAFSVTSSLPEKRSD